MAGLVWLYCASHHQCWYCCPCHPQTLFLEPQLVLRTMALNMIAALMLVGAEKALPPPPASICINLICGEDLQAVIPVSPQQQIVEVTLLHNQLSSQSRCKWRGTQKCPLTNPALKRNHSSFHMFMVYLLFMVWVHTLWHVINLDRLKKQDICYGSNRSAVVYSVSCFQKLIWGLEGHVLDPFVWVVLLPNIAACIAEVLFQLINYKPQEKSGWEINAAQQDYMIQELFVTFENKSHYNAHCNFYLLLCVPDTVKLCFMLSANSYFFVKVSH